MKGSVERFTISTIHLIEHPCAINNKTRQIKTEMPLALRCHDYCRKQAQQCLDVAYNQTKRPGVEED